jgi:hypothetical protein
MEEDMEATSLPERPRDIAAAEAEALPPSAEGDARRREELLLVLLDDDDDDECSEMASREARKVDT